MGLLYLSSEIVKIIRNPGSTRTLDLAYSTWLGMHQRVHTWDLFYPESSLQGEGIVELLPRGTYYS